jgi:hypothetical protein
MFAFATPLPGKNDKSPYILLHSLFSENIQKKVGKGVPISERNVGF